MPRLSLIDVSREAGYPRKFHAPCWQKRKADPIDSPLGSTALGGAVCTLIHLKRSESMRTIQTVQRIGQDIPETVLESDWETRTLSLGGEKVDALVHTVRQRSEYFKVSDGRQV